MLNAAWLMEWKERRGRRRVQAEARHLVREARRVLEKRSDKIPEAVARDVEASAAEVDRALETSASGEDTERLRQAVGRLDEKMDEHLAFARKSSVREYVESIGVAVAIALLLRAFVVEAFQIPSGSMIPTLEVGDHIFVSKFSYGIGIPFTYKKLVQFGAPQSRRRHRVSVSRRSRGGLHQARGGAARREDRGSQERDLHRRQADAPRAHPGPVQLRGGSGGSGRAQVRVVAGTARRPPASGLPGSQPDTDPVRPDRRPPEPRVRDGRQPRQLQRFSRLGHRPPGVHQRPGA